MPRDDLQALELVCARAADRQQGSGAAPEVALYASGATWRKSDLRRLARIARTAVVAGDLGKDRAELLERILEVSLSEELVPLSAGEQWAKAIRWAMDDLARRPSTGLAPGSTTRAIEVGLACARLRAAGYPVSINGTGCRIEDPAKSELLRRIDGLVRCVGGAETLFQLFRILREQHRYQDGMWLLGDLQPVVGSRKDPTLPYGWLLAAGSKHVGPPPRKLRRPEVAWRNLTSLMTDYAALQDVERYSNLERINVAPGDLVEILGETLGWHQLFTFPRYRPNVVLEIVSAMSKVMTGEDWSALGLDPARLREEVRTVLATALPDSPTPIDARAASRAFPILSACALGGSGEVNRDFVDPSHAPARNDGGLLLYAMGPKSLLLPTAISAASAATFLITRIWAKLKSKRAEKVVGEVCERVVEVICKKAPRATIRPDLKYVGDGKKLQIDVLVEEPDGTTVVEVKAKALTREALTGDIVKLLLDYKNSYLAMLGQLARHERHLRVGNPALPSVSSDARVAKVATSPLTYGPLSDISLGRTILSTLVRSRIIVADDHPAAAEILGKLQTKLNEVVAEIQALFASRPDTRNDLLAELLNFHWLDMAQLDAVVQRSGGLAAGLKSVRHVSFASQDLWHELALRDRLNAGSGTSAAS